MVGILLTSTDGCGGNVKGKQDKDYVKKQEEVLQFFKELDVPDEIQQMVRKLGDLSVSTAELAKFITRLKEGDEKKNDEDDYERRSREEEFMKQGFSNGENQGFEHNWKGSRAGMVGAMLPINP